MEDSPNPNSFVSSLQNLGPTADCVESQDHRHQDVVNVDANKPLSSSQLQADTLLGSIADTCMRSSAIPEPPCVGDMDTQSVQEEKHQHIGIYHDTCTNDDSTDATQNEGDILHAVCPDGLPGQDDSTHICGSTNDETISPAGVTMDITE